MFEEPLTLRQTSQFVKGIVQVGHLWSRIQYVYENLKSLSTEIFMIICIELEYYYDCLNISVAWIVVILYRWGKRANFSKIGFKLNIEYKQSNI